MNNNNSNNNNTNTTTTNKGGGVDEVTVQSLQMKWQNLLAEKRAGARESRLVELLSKDIAVDFPLLCRDLHGSNFERIFGDGETLFHLLCFSVKFLQVSNSPTAAVTSVENLQLIMLISMILEPTAHAEQRHFSLYENYLSHAVQSDLPAVLTKNVKSFFELLSNGALFNEDEPASPTSTTNLMTPSVNGDTIASASSSLAMSPANENTTTALPSAFSTTPAAGAAQAEEQNNSNFATPMGTRYQSSARSLEEEISLGRDVTRKLRHFRTLESERSIQDFSLFSSPTTTNFPEQQQNQEQKQKQHQISNNDSDDDENDNNGDPTVVLRRRISSVALRFAVRNLNALQSLLSPQAVSVHEDVRSVLAENLIGLSNSFSALIRIEHRHTSLAPSIAKQVYQVLNCAFCRFSFPTSASAKSSSFSPGGFSKNNNQNQNHAESSRCPAYETLDASVQSLRRAFSHAKNELSQDKNSFMCKMIPTVRDLEKEKKIVQDRLDVLNYAVKSLRALLSCALSTKPMPLNVKKMTFPELIEAVNSAIQATAALTVISDEYFARKQKEKENENKNKNDDEEEDLQSPFLNSTSGGRSISSQLLSSPASPNVVGSPSSHQPPSVATKLFNDNVNSLLNSLVFVALSPINDDDDNKKDEDDTNQQHYHHDHHPSASSSDSLTSALSSSPTTATATLQHDEFGQPVSSSAQEQPLFVRTSQFDRKGAIQHSTKPVPKIVVSASSSGGNLEKDSSSSGFFSKIGKTFGKVVDAITSKDDDDEKKKKKNNKNDSSSFYGNNNEENPYASSYEDDESHQMRVEATRIAILQNQNGPAVTVPGILWLMTELIVNKIPQSTTNVVSNNNNFNNNNNNNSNDDDDDQTNSSVHTFAYYQLQSAIEKFANKLFDWLGSISIGELSWTLRNQIIFYLLDHSNKLSSRLQVSLITSITILVERCGNQHQHHQPRSSPNSPHVLLPPNSASSFSTNTPPSASMDSLQSAVKASNAISSSSIQNNNNNNNNNNKLLIPSVSSLASMGSATGAPGAHHNNEVANIVMKLAVLLSPTDMWLTYDGASATIMLFNSIIRGLGGDRQLATDLIRAGFQVVLSIIERYISSDDDVACFRIDSSLPGSTTDLDTRKRHNATLFALLSEFWTLLLSSSLETEKSTNNHRNKNDSSSHDNLSSYCNAEKAVEVFLRCSNSPHGITTSSSARNMLRSLVAKYPRSNIFLVSFLKTQLKKAYEEEEHERVMSHQSSSSMMTRNKTTTSSDEQQQQQYYESSESSDLDGTVRTRLNNINTSSRVRNPPSSPSSPNLKKDETQLFATPKSSRQSLGEVGEGEETAEALKMTTRSTAEFNGTHTYMPDNDDEHGDDDDDENDSSSSSSSSSNETKKNTTAAEDEDDRENAFEEDDADHEASTTSIESLTQHAESLIAKNRNATASTGRTDGSSTSVLTVREDDALSQSVLSVASVLVDTKDGPANISYFLQEGGMQIAIDIFIFIARVHNNNNNSFTNSSKNAAETILSDRLRPISLLLSILVPHVRFMSEPNSLSSTLLSAMRKHKGIEKSVTATQLLIDLVTLQLTVDGGDRILKWIERRLDPEDYQLRLSRLEKEGVELSPERRASMYNAHAQSSLFTTSSASKKTPTAAAQNLKIFTNFGNQSKNNNNNNMNLQALLPNRSVGPFFLRDPIEGDGPTQLTLCLVPDLFQELIQWYDSVLTATTQATTTATTSSNSATATPSTSNLMNVANQSSSTPNTVQQQSSQQQQQQQQQTFFGIEKYLSSLLSIIVEVSEKFLIIPVASFALFAARRNLPHQLLPKAIMNDNVIVNHIFRSPPTRSVGISRALESARFSVRSQAMHLVGANALVSGDVETNFPNRDGWCLSAWWRWTFDSRYSHEQMMMEKSPDAACSMNAKKHNSKNEPKFGIRLFEFSWKAPITGRNCSVTAICWPHIISSQQQQQTSTTNVDQNTTATTTTSRARNDSTTASSSAKQQQQQQQQNVSPTPSPSTSQSAQFQQPNHLNPSNMTNASSTTTTTTATRLELILNFGGSDVVKENFILEDSSNNWVHLVVSRIRSKEQARRRAPGEFLVLYRDGVRVPQYLPPLSSISPSSANDMMAQERQAELLQELEKYFDEIVGDRSITTRVKLDIGMGLSRQNEFDLRTLRFTNLNVIAKPINAGAAVALYSQRFVSPSTTRASLHTSAHRASDLILENILSEHAVRAATAWCRSGVDISPSENTIPACFETSTDDYIMAIHPAVAVRLPVPRVGDYSESRQWALVNLAGTRRRPMDPFVLKGFHSVPTVSRYEFCHRAICLGGMETMVKWLHDSIREENVEDIVKCLRVLSLISLRVDFARCTDRTLWMQAAKAMAKSHVDRRVVHAVLDGCFVDLHSGDFITCEVQNLAQQQTQTSSLMTNQRTSSSFALSPNKRKINQPSPCYENAAVCNVALVEQGLLQWQTTAHKPEFVGEEITRALLQLLSEKNPYCHFNANRLYRTQLMLHLTHGVARHCLAQSTMISCGRVMSAALRCGGDWLRLSVGRMLAFVMLTVPLHGDEDSIKTRLFTVMPVRGYLETLRNIVLRAFVDALAQFPSDSLIQSQQQEREFFEGGPGNNNNTSPKLMSPLLAALVQRFPPWLIAFLIGPDSSAETAALTLRLLERFMLSPSYRSWCHQDNGIFFTSLFTRLPAFARSKDILAIVTRLALGAKPTAFSQPYDFLAPNVAVSGSWVKNTFGQPVAAREFMPLLWMMLDQLLMYHTQQQQQQQQVDSNNNSNNKPPQQHQQPNQSSTLSTPSTSNLKVTKQQNSSSSTSSNAIKNPLIAASLKNYFEFAAQPLAPSWKRKFHSVTLVILLVIKLCKTYSTFKSNSGERENNNKNKRKDKRNDNDDEDDENQLRKRQESSSGTDDNDQEPEISIKQQQEESIVIDQMSGSGTFNFIPPPPMKREETSNSAAMTPKSSSLSACRTPTGASSASLSRRESFSGGQQQQQQPPTLQRRDSIMSTSSNQNITASSSSSSPNAIEIVQRIASLCVSQCNYHPEIVEALLEFTPSGTQPTLDAITRAMYTSAKQLVAHITPSVSTTTPTDDAKLIAFEEDNMVIPLTADHGEVVHSIQLQDLPQPLHRRHFHLSDLAVQHIQDDDDPLFSTTLQLLAKVLDGSLMMMTLSSTGNNNSSLSATFHQILSGSISLGDRLDSFFSTSGNHDSSSSSSSSGSTPHPNSVTFVVHYLLARLRMFGPWNVAPSPAVVCMISLLIKTSIKTVFKRLSKLVKQRIDSGETKNGPVAQMIFPVALSCLQLARYLSERFTAGMLVPVNDLFQFLTEFISEITPLALLPSSSSAHASEFSQMRKKAQALLFDCTLYISSSSFHRYSRLLMGQAREVLAQYARQIFLTFSSSAGNKKDSFSSDESAPQAYNSQSQQDYLKKFLPRLFELSFDALFDDDSSPTRGRRHAGEIWFALVHGPLGMNSSGFMNVLKLIRENCVSSSNIDFPTTFKMFSEDKNLGVDFFMDWLSDKQPFIAFGVRAAFQIYTSGPLRLDTCNPRQHALGVYRLSSTIIQEQQQYLAETACFASINASNSTNNFNNNTNSAGDSPNSINNNNNNNSPSLTFAASPGSAEHAIMLLQQQQQNQTSSSPSATATSTSTTTNENSSTSSSSNRKIRDRDSWIERNRAKQLDQATWVDPAVVCLRPNSTHSGTGESYFSDKAFATYHRAVRCAVPLDADTLALCYDVDTGIVYRSRPPPSITTTSTTSSSSNSQQQKKEKEKEFLYSVGTQDRIGIPFPSLTTYVGGGASPFESKRIHFLPSTAVVGGRSLENHSNHSSSSALDNQSGTAASSSASNNQTKSHHHGDSNYTNSILSSASRRLAVRLFSDERAEPLFASNVYVISGQDYLICVMIITSNELVLISHCTLTAAGDLQIAPQKEHFAEVEQQQNRQNSGGSLRDMFNKWIFTGRRQQQLESNACHNFSQVFRESRARAAMQKQPLAKIWRFNTNWISHARHRSFHHQNAGLEIVLDGGAKWFLVILDTDFTMSTKLRDECGELLKAMHSNSSSASNTTGKSTLLNDKESGGGSSFASASALARHYQNINISATRQNYCNHFIPVFDDILMKESRKKMKEMWLKRTISNFAYLSALNDYGSRTSADVTQFPVFPWVITEFDSTKLDLSSTDTYRDLARPAGALNPARAEELQTRFAEWPDPDTKPFHHGTHYSTSAIVMYYLIRYHPFYDMHKSYQGGKVDKAERLFHSISDAFKSVMSGRGDVKELIAEWFVNGDVFLHTGVELGKKQDGTVLGPVVLPPWSAGSPHRFVALQRLALESAFVTQHLPDWLDLIFGQKQQGELAEKNLNVFMRSTYESGLTAAMTEFENPAECAVFVAQVRDFGLTPKMFMKNLHPRPPSLPTLPRQQLFLQKLAQNKFTPISHESYSLFQNVNDFANELRLAGGTATFPAALAGPSEGSIVEIAPNLFSGSSSSSSGGNDSSSSHHRNNNPVAAAASSLISGISNAAAHSPFAVLTGISPSASTSAHETLSKKAGSCRIIANSSYYILLGNEAPFSWLVFDGKYGVSVHTFTTDPQSGHAYEKSLFRFPSTFAYGSGTLTHISSNTTGSVVCFGSTSGVLFIYRRDVRDDVYSYQLSQILQPPKFFNVNNLITKSFQQQHQRVPSQATTTNANNTPPPVKQQQDSTSTTSANISNINNNNNRISMLKFLKDQLLAIVYDKCQLVLWMCTVQRVEFVWECNLALLPQTPKFAPDFSPVVSVSSIHVGGYWHRIIVAQERSVTSFSPRGVLLGRMSLDAAPGRFATTSVSPSLSISQQYRNNNNNKNVLPSNQTNQQYASSTQAAAGSQQSRQHQHHVDPNNNSNSTTNNTNPLLSESMTNANYLTSTLVSRDVSFNIAAGNQQNQQLQQHHSSSSATSSIHEDNNNHHQRQLSSQNISPANEVVNNNNSNSVPPQQQQQQQPQEQQQQNDTSTSMSASTTTPSQPPLISVAAPSTTTTVLEQQHQQQQQLSPSNNPQSQQQQAATTTTLQEAMTSTIANTPRSNITAMIALSMPTYSSKGEVILCGHADGSLSTWQLELDHNASASSPSLSSPSSSQTENNNNNSNNNSNTTTNVAAGSSSTSSQMANNNNNLANLNPNNLLIECMRFVSNVGVHVPANLKTSGVHSESATKVTALMTNVGIVPIEEFMIVVAFGDRQVQVLTASMKETS